MLAERYGRRPTVIANNFAFSIFELASAFAPTLHIFLICRALFGIAMGGEWGVGAAVAAGVPLKGEDSSQGFCGRATSLGIFSPRLSAGTVFPHLHGAKC